MTIQISPRYDSTTKKNYFVATSTDEPGITGEGDSVEAAMNELHDQMREEFHPDRVPLRLYEQEAEFLRNHDRIDE